MEAMTSLERAMATIHHQIPDRVPVDLHNFLATIRYAGYSMAEALQDGEMMAEAQLKFWKDFGHDVLLVENGVCAEAEACGCEVYYSDEAPRVVGPVLAGGLEKIDELEIPDPNTAHPMCEVIKAVQILVKEIGDRVYIMGRADQGPVALAAGLRGWEEFIVDMALNREPELIQKVIDFAYRVHRRYAEALREAGAHGTSMGEAGVDIIGPHLYRRFAQPYDRRLVEAVGSPDFPVAVHICGDATLILEDMVATGAQILELDYKTDMHKAKQILQGKSTFLGPINPALLWDAESPIQVENAARQAIEILAPGGGLILGPGCALGYDTPLDNIHALIESAKKYGVYNPDGSLKKAN